MLYNTLTRLPTVSVERSPVSIPQLDKGVTFLNGSRDDIFLEAQSLTCTSKTSYRLPRLFDNDSKPEEVRTERGHKLWSRHGYDYYHDRQAQLQIMSARLHNSPHLVPREVPRAYQMASSSPKFRHAMISPTKPPQTRYYAGGICDPALYKHMLKQNQNISPLFGYHDKYPERQEAGPAPTPVPDRSYSPPKSAQSIHWTLSPTKNLNYDRKLKHTKDLQGRGRAQGPYSREFTVTCAAPNNWLRMKLGRSKTFVR